MAPAARGANGGGGGVSVVGGGEGEVAGAVANEEAGFRGSLGVAAARDRLCAVRGDVTGAASEIAIVGSGGGASGDDGGTAASRGTSISSGSGAGASWSAKADAARGRSTGRGASVRLASRARKSLTTAGRSFLRRA